MKKNDEKATFFATYPLVPIKLENLNLLERRKRAITELIKLSGKLPLYNPENKNISFEINYQSKNDKEDIPEESICFIAEFVPSKCFEARKIQADDPNSEENIVLQVFSHYFVKFIYDLLLIVHLSEPGALEFQFGKVIINNFYNITLPPFGKTFANAIEMSKHIVWPPIDSLPLSKVIKFFRKGDTLLPGFSSTNVERSLSAFTYLFTPQPTNELLLMWSMVGIEALFTKESAGIMEQVRSKIFTLLGSDEKGRKLISKMYNLRSKFLHGGVDIPTNKFGTNFMEPGTLQYDDDLLKTIEFSQVLLVSCLQKVIKLGKNPIEFNYKID
ncbi:hypothetical protein [Leptospira stimsonii]|uniref:Apea-like HEPN domain-containing protein n=1 Tax=Leptospira stimsonii TaxID=2202203 RepID=A0A8B3CI47_9LEPT|nr:hypothetical protein [Leptospira stimsonii]RHX83390.1 hypothetical protein DLM78_22085 [Leptospira stimsonii]